MGFAVLNLSKVCACKDFLGNHSEGQGSLYPLQMCTGKTTLTVQSSIFSVESVEGIRETGKCQTVRLSSKHICFNYFKFVRACTHMIWKKGL